MNEEFGRQLHHSIERLTQSLERINMRGVPNSSGNDPDEPGNIPSRDPLRNARNFVRPRHDDDDEGPPGRIQQKARRKFIEPTKFSGEAMVWEEYLIKFELVAEWNMWTEEEACEFLLMSLEGDAAIHIHSMTDFRDIEYKTLCDALTDRFGVNKTLAEDKRKFRLRKKMKGETYAHMAQDILRLARRIYRADFRLADQEAREQFLKGLPNDMRLIVSGSNPKTLSECVDNVAQIHIVLEKDQMDEETAKAVVSRAVKTNEENKSGTSTQQNNNKGRGRGRNNSRGRGRGNRGRGNGNRDGGFNQNRNNSGYNGYSGASNYGSGGYNGGYSGANGYGGYNNYGGYGTYNRNFDMSKVDCRNCGELGHMKRDCPKPWGYKFSKPAAEKKENDAALAKDTAVIAQKDGSGNVPGSVV